MTQQPPIRDVNLSVSKALPAAAATNYTNSIDLGDQAPAIKLPRWQLEVAIPTLPSLADAKTYTATVQDSADNVSFAAVPTLAPIVLTGAGGAGVVGKTQLYALPKDVRRFVRLQSTVLTAGADNTAQSVTFSAVR